VYYKKGYAIVNDGDFILFLRLIILELISMRQLRAATLALADNNAPVPAVFDIRLKVYGLK
jgi:hypothetical protein